jgi:YidC/Oxa1 family membrane protein insertase
VAFSRDRNILILMLDGFPGGYLQKILDEAPATLAEYDGFTWYPNTLSTGADTLSAIGAVAGGHRYEAWAMNATHHESVGKAIAHAYRVPLDAFGSKGYRTAAVNPAYSTCDALDRSVDCIDTSPYGVYYRDTEQPDVALLQGQGSHVPRLLVMVSLLKAAPFLAKAWIYDDAAYLGAHSESVRHMVSNTVKAREWGFLRLLARHPSATSPDPTFKFIQLSIPHGPQALDRECLLRPAGASVFTESVCALREIGALLSWLKREGLYDVTKIVLVSDHGWYVDDPMFPPTFDRALPRLHGWISIPGIAHPLLLVKDFAARGRFRRAETFLSNADVPAIVCPAAGGCPGIGPDPTVHDLGPRTLVFTHTAWPAEEADAKSLEIKATFQVRESIFVPAHWTWTIP